MHFYDMITAVNVGARIRLKLKIFVISNLVIIFKDLPDRLHKYYEREYESLNPLLQGIIKQVTPNCLDGKNKNCNKDASNYIDQIYKHVNIPTVFQKLVAGIYIGKKLITRTMIRKIYK